MWATPVLLSYLRMGFQNLELLTLLILVISLLLVRKRFILFILAFLGACGDRGNTAPQRTCDACPKEINELLTGSFWVKNAKSSYHSDLAGAFDISTRNIKGIPRKGRIFVFEKFDDIIVDDVYIRQSVLDELMFVDTRALVLSIMQFYSGHPEDENISSSVEGQALRHRASRILMKNVTIDLHSRRGGWVKLLSSDARVNVDASAIFFYGGVRIVSAGCSLVSESAVWSAVHNGIILSNEYSVNGRTKRGSSLYKIYSNRGCVREVDVPVVVYKDDLDDFEDEVIKAIPPELTPYLGVLGL